MIAKHKFWRGLTRIHKWAGFVLGIQIILWFASGFFMSFFSIDKVHGDHMALEHEWPLNVDQLAADSMISPQQVLALHAHKGSAVNSLNLRSALGKPIWEIKSEQGDVLVDAKTGGLWQGLSVTDIRDSAQSYYKGKGQILSAKHLDIAPKDYGKELPVWQVIYEDSARTRLYISPNTGELINVRTRLWRAFDFMWMLHIMDYKTRDNINLWWLKLLSFSALLFSLSGLGLVVHRVFLRPRLRKESPR